MFAKKTKQKQSSTSQAATQALTGELKTVANRTLQKLFGLEPDWYKHRDIFKNNYLLGVKNFRLGRANDALLRFKLATWLNDKHADAWYGLGRTYLIQGKRHTAETVLKKSIKLDPAHVGAKTLLAAIPLVYDTEKPPIAMREAGTGDATILSRLHQDSFVKSWSEKEFADMLAIDGTQAWITGLSTLPMGMIVGRSLGEQYEIITLTVSPDWRGRGLARQLLEKVTARAKETGAKSMFLEVSVENDIARKFYENAGFTVINTRKDYYRQPDGSTRDALVMQMDFPQA